MPEAVASIHQIELDLIQADSLSAILSTLVGGARQAAHARYALAGIFDGRGGWESVEYAGWTSVTAGKLPYADRWNELAAGVARERAAISRLEPYGSEGAEFAYLGVPIPSKGRIVGRVDLLEYRPGGAFPVESRAQVEELAAFAAAAAENVFALAELQSRQAELTQRNRELTIFNDVSVAASNTLELEGILATALDRMMMHFHAWNGAVFLAEEDRSGLRIALQRGDLRDSYWGKEVFAFGQGFIGRVADSKELLAVLDPLEEEYFRRDVFLRYGLRMLIGIPLVSKGQVLGVMVLAAREPVELTERQRVLFEAVGLSVGTAVENGLLHRKSQRLAVLEERERIGMDLHDGIIQSIYAVGLLLEEGRLDVTAAPESTGAILERAIAGLNAVIRDLRAYIHNLQPQRYIFDNLAMGIDLLVKEFSVNTQAMVEEDLSQEAARGMAPAPANALFHITQEALANIARHARASHVKISLMQVEDRVVLELADDGVGFDPAQQKTSSGRGLTNIEERARGVEGELAIQSNPGSGTVIRVSIPRIRPQTGNLAGKISRGTGPIRRG